jgi:hypothetical protein
MEHEQTTADLIVAEHMEAYQLPPPGAWIGSHDDYEADQQFGGWVDLSQRPREVMLAVRDIIDRSPGDLSREWDICATRGLGGWVPTGNDGLPTAISIARGVMRFGEHYGGLASALGADSPALSYERYDISYLGSWATPRAFVEQVVADSGWHNAMQRLPRSMQPYLLIDYRALIRDAKRELTFVDHPEGVWVYDPRVW